MAKSEHPIQPVILSGGAGTRLWPLSRRAMPKQFLALVGGTRSLLQETALRVADKRRFRGAVERRDQDRENRTERTFQREVHRPCGTYRDVGWEEENEGKRIVAKPGGRLSPRRHARRSEYSVVVAGMATRIARHESVDVTAGRMRRLKHRTVRPTHLIEAGIGANRGKDDIERFDDVYRR